MTRIALLQLRVLQSRPVKRWLALRARAAKWLFGTPTTVLEVLNAGLLLIWAVALQDDALVTLPFYSAAFRVYSASWVNEAVSCVFFAAFIFACVGAYRSGRRADMLSGYALQLSSLLWVAVAINFLGAYPPLNTEVLAYGLQGVICWTCGCHLWTRGKWYSQRDKRAGGRDDE